MSNTPATVGILGLGLVGHALASRLQACGHRVTGFDPSPAAQSAARATGVAIAAAPQELATQCEVILVCVLDDAMLASCTQAIAVHPGVVKLVVSCVTASVQATEQAAALIEGQQLDFADMPLLGSSRQIGQGEALGLLGSSDSVLERWNGLLADICPRYRHVGKAGYGVRAKLACNLVLGLNRAALAEGLALATTLGLDGTDFLDLLRESPAYSRAVDVAGPRMVARDFTPASRIRQHRKDLALILQEGKGADLNLSLTAAHAELLDRAIAQGMGDQDNVAVIAAILPGAKSTTPSTSGKPS
jgi:3-hydroxyisobutyrate dehydrogenase-like beta-hydroxyacid dehydrogenase